MWHRCTVPDVLRAMFFVAMWFIPLFIITFYVIHQDILRDMCVNWPYLWKAWNRPF